MNVVGAIRQILLDSAQVTSLLADDSSVYPVVVPQEKTFPAITLSVVETRPNGTKTDTSQIDNVRVELAVYAKDYAKAQEIGTMARNAIDGFRGGVETSDANEHYIDEVMFLSYRDGFDSENILYARLCMYDVRYYRELPPLPFGTAYPSQSAVWAASLPMWNNDEDAQAGGVDERGVTQAALDVGDVYLTGPLCDFAAYGTIKVIMG